MGMRYTFVHSMIDTIVGLGYPVVYIFIVFFYDINTSIGRPSVNDYILKVTAGLVDHTLNGLTQTILIVVIDGDN
jgi:hypothetical protein